MGVLYDDYLNQHRENVYMAFEWIEKNLPEVIPENVDADDLNWRIGYAHDISKNSPEEYDAYDDYFYGGNRASEVIEKFRYAWLHHIHNNPHHWQYWILKYDDPNEGEIVLEMPVKYAIEMICDWWAFSFAKGDLSEIFDWYEERKNYIKLHENTRKYVEDVLDKITRKLDTVPNEIVKESKESDI